MRRLVVSLVLCACGRLEFEARSDGAAGPVLAITSPGEDAEVDATVTLTGTCAPGLAIEIGGDGLATPSSAACDGDAFSTVIAFTDGDGPKLVTVAQGTASATRTFVRVTRAAPRGMATGTAPSAGFMTDCDLVIARPTDLRAGDLVFGMIYTDGGNQGSIATPTFTRTGLDGPTRVAFWKLAGAAEPASYTFRIVAGTGAADTCESAGVLVAFAGISSTTPILAESTNVDGNDPSVVALGVTAPAAGLLVGAWGSNGPAGGFTVPAGMQVAGAASSPGDFANAVIAFEPVAAGPTGDRTATLPQTRPAAAGLFVLNGRP